MSEREPVTFLNNGQELRMTKKDKRALHKRVRLWELCFKADITVSYFYRFEW